MSGIWKILSVASAIAALGLPMMAQAQTPSSMMKSASMSTSGATKPGIAGRWTCISRTTVEIAPVSFDTGGLPSGWVMVQRDKGEIVSAERVSSKEVEQIRRLPCGTPDSDLGGIALVG